MTLRIGTRGSELALWQARWVASELEKKKVASEIVIITTSGDRDHGSSVVQLGLQGVFTREIQRALLAGEIDLAVHSLKDLPTAPVPGLEIAAVPERADWRDAFVCPKYPTLRDLPEGSVIGTGSLRRQSQLRALFPGRFSIRDLRGNVRTRLAKLDAGEYDAMILAAAGLTRLACEDRIRSFLAPPDFLPAPGQGALALEIRIEDESTRAIVAPLDDWATHASVVAERAFLEALQGGCIAPIAAYARWNSRLLTLTGRIVSPDGTQSFEESCQWTIPEEFSFSRLNNAAGELGIQLAKILLKRGANAIVEQIVLTRKDNNARSDHTSRPGRE